MVLAKITVETPYCLDMHWLDKINNDSFSKYHEFHFYETDMCTEINFEVCVSWIQENKELKNTVEQNIERAYMHGRQFLAAKVLYVKIVNH